MPTPNFAISAVTLAVLQAFSTYVRADDAAPTAATAAADQALPEVIVNAKAPVARAAIAGFADTPLMQTPASVSVLTLQQMQDRDIHSTTDAARYDASLSDPTTRSATPSSSRSAASTWTTNRATARTAWPSRPTPRSRWKTRSASKCSRDWPVWKRASPRRAASSTTSPSGRPTRHCAPSPSRNASAARCTAPSTSAAASTIRPSATASTSPPSACAPTSRAPTATANSSPARSTGRSRRRPCCNWTPIRIQGADFGARLPADQRHHAAQGRSRHDAQQPAVEQGGDDHQQQSRPALRIPVERAVEDRLQRQPAPVPPRRLHRLPRRLRRHGPRLLRQRRLQRLRLHQPGRTQIAADRASHGAGPVRHRRTDARLQRRLLVLQEQRKMGDDFYTIAGLSNIYHPVVVTPPEGSSGPVLEQRSDHERAVFAQDILGLSSTVKLHLGA